MKNGKWMMAMIVAVLAISLVIPAGAADVRGRLFVKIVNSEGKPVEGVVVTLVSEVSESKTYTMDPTDKKGKTMIVGLDPDHYKVTCVKDGFQELQKTTKLRPGVNVKEEWTLLTPEEAKAEAIAKAKEKMSEEELKKYDAMDAHNRGVTALEANNMEEAKMEFEKSIELDPDVSFFGYLVLGQIAFNAHDVEKAQNYLLTAKEKDTEKAAVADIGSLLGATYMIQEKPDMAKAIWTELVQTNPNQMVLYNLAGIEVRAGNLDEAMKWLSMSIENFPDDVDSLRLLGDIYIQKNDYPKATEMYEKLLTAMKTKEGITPEALKEVEDTVKLLKETVKK